MTIIKLNLQHIFKILSYLLVSQWWPSYNILHWHVTLPFSWTLHFAPFLQIFLLFGEHLSALMQVKQNLDWSYVIAFKIHYYSINDVTYIPIWQYLPSFLMLQTHFTWPFLPIEQVPPFLQMFIPPGAHLSDFNNIL